MCCDGSDTVGKAVAAAVFESYNRVASGRGLNKRETRHTLSAAKIRMNTPIGRGVGLMFGVEGHLKLRVPTWVVEAFSPCLWLGVRAVTGYSDFGYARYCTVWSPLHVGIVSHYAEVFYLCGYCSRYICFPSRGHILCDTCKRDNLQ